MDVNHRPSNIQRPDVNQAAMAEFENDGVWQNRLLRVPVWCSSFLAFFLYTRRSRI